MTGQIKSGDEYAFEHFLRDHPNGEFKTVQIAGPGGFLEPAIEIGRIIRAQNLATYVDAAKSSCASACTVIFTAGVRRYYANAANIHDGEIRHGGTGLGFHQGSDPLSLEASGQSGAASAYSIAAYYEFGVPGAARLVEKASASEMFRISGQTALSLGIATSLSPP